MAPGFSKTRQEEINAPPGLSVPSPPICSRPCAPPQSLELTGRASCFGMAVRGFAGPERTTGFGVSALPAIDGHPDKQSFRGSRSRASSPQSHGSKEKGTSWNGTRSARGPAQKLPRWSGVVDPGLAWLAWPKTKLKILGPARALEWAG